MIQRKVQLLLLLLGVAVTLACVFNGKDVTQPNTARTNQPPQRLSLEIPNAPWEAVFFEALAQRTTKVGMPSLRTQVLPGQDLEVRFWYDHFEIISGVIIRRSREKWSADYLRQKYDHQPSSAQLKSLGAPKSGWEAAWSRLTSAGILTLPGGTTKCRSDVLYGIGYVVETNVNQKYRTYRYANPQFADCDEAKRVMSIESIIAEEFPQK
jgi:hypothetical protein